MLYTVKMIQKYAPYVILTCIFVIIFTMYGVLRNDGQQPSFEYDRLPKIQTIGEMYSHRASLAKILADQNSSVTLSGKNSQYPIYQDLNCVATIPETLVDVPGDMPVAIPESLALPESVLACLYHRYVKTIQTPCVEPKLFGLADDHIYVWTRDSSKKINAKLSSLGQQ